MGAGNFSAGGYAGFDPVQAAPILSAYVPPQALAYDPNTKQFIFLSNGQGAAMDPVDQAVLIAVTLVYRSLSSATATGIVLTGIQSASAVKLQDTITDAVSTALATLISKGYILFNGAPIAEQSNAGQLVFYVDYTNLKSPGKPVQQIQLNA